MQVRAADRRHHGRQHLGSVPAGAAAGLRPGGDPSLLLERLPPRTSARQDLLQGVQADGGEGGCRGEPGGRDGGGCGGGLAGPAGPAGLVGLAGPAGLAGLAGLAGQGLLSCAVLQEVRKASESIKYNHPLRRCVDTVLRKVSPGSPADGPGLRLEHHSSLMGNRQKAWRDQNRCAPPVSPGPPGEDGPEHGRLRGL